MTITKPPYKIGIDCRLAGIQNAGIGRYIENLITRLPKISNKQNIQWIFFFYDKEQYDQVLQNKNLIDTNVETVFIPIRHYTIDEQLQLPKIFASQQLDLLHVPHFNIPIFYPGKMIVTIHDLLWHEYRGLHVTTLPAWKYHLKYSAYKFTVSQAVSKASQILVPAKTIQSTLLKYYPQAKNKITVTYEGSSLTKVNKKSTLNSQLSTLNLLYLGSLYPHKNIKVVLEALTKLPGYKLQIVGARNIFQDQIVQQVKERGLENQVEFLGFVKDDDLPKLFNQALALVQPSLFEGFGLTGIEAMSQGIPVIASNIPIFREIYQDAAVFFDPHQADSVVQAIKKLESPKFRKERSQSGLKLSSIYSWENMTQETLTQYLKILSKD